MAHRWHDGLKVGIEMVDEDHRRLFEILNTLDGEVGDDPARIDAILDDLLTYAAQHFAREEAIQEEAGFEGLEENRRQHRELTLTLDVFLAKYRAGGLGEPAVAAAKIRDFLTIWIEEHIQKTDLRMRGRILPWAG